MLTEREKKNSISFLFMNKLSINDMLREFDEFDRIGISYFPDAVSTTFTVYQDLDENDYTDDIISSFKIKIVAAYNKMKLFNVYTVYDEFSIYKDFDVRLGDFVLEKLKGFDRNYGSKFEKINLSLNDGLIAFRTLFDALYGKYGITITKEKIYYEKE